MIVTKIIGSFFIGSVVALGACKNNHQIPNGPISHYTPLIPKALPPITNTMIDKARNKSMDFLADILLQLQTNNNTALVNKIHATRRCDQTALHYAIELGCEDTVRALLARGADVNVKTPRGSIPLYLALCCGNLGIVRILLAQPTIDVNLPDKNNETPLYGAAENGMAEAVELLLAYAARTNIVSSTTHLTPFAIATREGTTAHTPEEIKAYEATIQVFKNRGITS